MPEVLKLRQKRSRARREWVVQIATAAFAEHGVDATSLTDVARAAGMPLPSLYDYFRDKRSLISAVSEQHFVELYRDIDALLPGQPTALGRLRVSYVETFRYVETHPDWARVFYLDIWPSSIAADPAVRSDVDRYGRRFVELIEGAIAAGELREGLDARLAMTMLMGAMCQLTAVWLLYGRRYDLVAKGEDAFALLTDAFAR